jgi:hypothetical protein
LNLLHRLIDGKSASAGTIEAPQALALNCQSALNSFQGTASKTFHFVRSVSAVFCAA